MDQEQLAYKKSSASSSLAPSSAFGRSDRLPCDATTVARVLTLVALFAVIFSSLLLFIATASNAAAATDPDPQQAALAPVPDGNSQAEAMKLIKEVYGPEVTAAKTADKRRALANKILLAAGASDKDRTSQFVLLRVARDIAEQAADSTTALEAVDEIAKVFQIDALEMKAEVFRKCAAAATTAEQHEALSGKAAEAAESAIAKDNFHAALQLNELATGEARKAKDDALVKRLAERGLEIGAMGRGYDAVKTALATLARDPHDLEANLTVGKYKCFAKNDWQGGLPMLAHASDPGLRKLAEDEAAGAASSDEQARLGEAWWNLAEFAKGTEQKQLQQRAAFWYLKALPGLSGLAKNRTLKRLSQSIRILFDSPSALNEFVGIDKKAGTVAVQKGNLVVTGSGSNHPSLIYRKYFQAISSVTIRGTVVSADHNNFRVAIGPIDMILNWEQQNQNLFFNGEKPVPYTRTSPHVMIPNVLNEIRIKKLGDDVQVSVNGKLLYSAKAELSGTITIYPSSTSAIAVHEIAIEGIPDPEKAVTAPSHNNIN